MDSEDKAIALTIFSVVTVALFTLTLWGFLFADTPDYVDSLICRNVNVEKDECADFIGLEHIIEETTTNTKSTYR